MNIKDITVELSTSNIIITYIDDRGYSQKRGFNHSNFEDWEVLESVEETSRMVEYFWKGKVKPENTEINNF